MPPTISRQHALPPQADGHRDQLDSLIDEAGRRELTIREALGMFCEREIARKDERRIEMSIGLARFPFVRDLAAGPAGRRQDAPDGRDRTRGHHGRLHGAVRRRADARRPARQGACGR
jgi:hypothetical protein